MPSLGPFIGFGNGTLLFFTFAAVGVTFNLVLDMVMRRVVSPEVRHRAGPTAAVTVQVLATIYAVLVAFVIVNQYSQLRVANEQVAAKAADLSAMYENSRIFPTPEGQELRSAITSSRAATSSCGITASAPLGSGAPVKMRTASPAASARAGARPAVTARP